MAEGKDSKKYTEKDLVVLLFALIGSAIGSLVANLIYDTLGKPAGAVGFIMLIWILWKLWKELRKNVPEG